MSAKHDLAEDFPQHAARIHEMKVQDHHFARLYAEYDDLQHEIRNINAEIEPAGDERIEQLKGRRVHLKDEMYRLLEEDARR
jgi:uncharacterized protein YdcH (DUF465 family)